MQVVM